jgi:flagellar basal body-associated protein FliL
VKTFFFADQKFSRFFYSALLSLAGALVVILTIGTIYALARPANSGPLFRLGKSNNTERAIPTAARTAARNDDIRVFSGLGRLRIPLSNSSTLLLSIAFPYNANDIAFSEELAAKIGEFRTAATGYFSSLPAEKLENLDEDAVKQEILRRFNSGLRLGRIEALYFSDMLIIDGSL